MEKYYLHLDNEQKGPFTIGQLRAMWQAGTIHRDTQYYTKGNGDWKKLAAILDLIEPTPPTAMLAAAAVTPLAAATAAKQAEDGKESADERLAPASEKNGDPSIPRAPAGLGRCPECGGLGGHLTDCSQGAASAASRVSPVAAATAAKVAEMPPPTAQEWKARMAETAQTTSSESSRMVHQSFPILNFFSSLMRGLGWLVFIIGVLWVLVRLTTTHGDNVLGLLMNLMFPMGVMALGILLIVIGEVIGVVFSIEKNTFKAAVSLDIIARNLRQNK